MAKPSKNLIGFSVVEIQRQEFASCVLPKAENFPIRVSDNINQSMGKNRFGEMSGNA